MLRRYVYSVASCKVEWVCPRPYYAGSFIAAIPSPYDRFRWNRSSLTKTTFECGRFLILGFPTKIFHGLILWRVPLLWQISPLKRRGFHRRSGSKNDRSQCRNRPKDWRGPRHGRSTRAVLPKTPPTNQPTPQPQSKSPRIPSQNLPQESPWGQSSLEAAVAGHGRGLWLAPEPARGPKGADVRRHRRAAEDHSTRAQRKRLRQCMQVCFHTQQHT